MEIGEAFMTVEFDVRYPLGYVQGNDCGIPWRVYNVSEHMKGFITGNESPYNKGRSFLQIAVL